MRPSKPRWVEEGTTLLSTLQRLAEGAETPSGLAAGLGELATLVERSWEATRCFFLLYDEAAGELVAPALLAGADEAVDVPRLRVEDTLVGTALREGSTCFAWDEGDLSAPEREILRRHRARHWLAVPLRAGEKMYGVMNLLLVEPVQLEGAAGSVVALFAEIALLLCGLQRLRQEREEIEALAQQRQVEVNALREISIAIRSIPRLEQTLEELVVSIGLMTEAEKCVFLLYDEVRGELVAQQPVLGLTEEEVECTRVVPTVGVSGYVFRTGQGYIVREVTTDPLLGPEREWARSLGVTSMLSVPLQVENQTLGVIHVLNKRSQQPFTEEDLALLNLLASQAAMILQNSRLHTAINNERHRLRTILRSLASAAIVLDRQQRIMLCNPVAEYLFSLREEEVLGRSLEEVLPREEILQALTALPEETKAEPPEITLTSPVEVILQIQVTDLRNERGEVLGKVIVFNDITHLRKVDQLKTEFVSTVSHELRTPLTSIKAFTATLLRDVEFDRETQKEWLKIIDSECDRLTRLINDLLSISRIESGRALEMEWKRVDLPQVIGKVLDQQRAYSTRHNLVYEGPASLIVEADEDKVIQILTNLVNNAIKYSPRGGLVRVKAVDNRDFAQVSVTDQGSGIRPDHLPKIFDKFYQVDSSSTRKVGGTGLGLYLTRHLVEAHGGKIWAESELNRGSTFTFTLPKRHLGEAEA